MGRAWEGNSSPLLFAAGCCLKNPGRAMLGPLSSCSSAHDVYRTGPNYSRLKLALCSVGRWSNQLSCPVLYKESRTFVDIQDFFYVCSLEKTRCFENFHGHQYHDWFGPYTTVLHTVENTSSRKSSMHSASLGTPARSLPGVLG